MYVVKTKLKRVTAERLERLANEVPILEDPSYEQMQWFIRKMKAPNGAWNTCIPHRPWILRWQYFILEDYNNEE